MASPARVDRDDRTQRLTVTVRLLDRNETRVYVVRDTGLPRLTQPEQLSGGTEQSGGLQVTDPSGALIGHFENWPWFLGFLSRMRAVLIDVTDLEQYVADYPGLVPMRYRVPTPDPTLRVFIEARHELHESPRWVVAFPSIDGVACADGSVIREPQPSSRTAEFIAETRFPTLEIAAAVAQLAIADQLAARADARAARVASRAVSQDNPSPVAPDSGRGTDSAPRETGPSAPKQTP